MSSNPASRIRTAAQRALAEHANEIRKLGKRTIEDIIEIGKHLIAAKELAGHGYWLSWLKQELGWASESSALRYMHVAELSESVSLTDLDIDLAALYRLAAPSTPSEVVEHVVALGRRITDEDVAARRIVDEVVDEEPPQAREISFVRGGFEKGEADQAWRSRYGAERKLPYYREEVEEQPVRQVRHQVTYERETVVVPYYVPHDQPAPRTIEDFQRDRNRGRAEALARHLEGVERNLDEQQDTGAIIKALTNEERDQARRVVDKLKAALDEDEIDVEAPDQLN
jgi:Protein of unknown function (DUF3102)